MPEQARKLAIALLQVVLFSNSYIALCAVVMCWTTTRLFHLKLPSSFLLFIFLGTLSSYALHWYLTPMASDQRERYQWNGQHKALLLGIFLGSAVLMLALLTQLVPYVRYFMPVVAATFLYTAPKIDYRPFRYLRRIAILKTAYLAFVWTFVTAVLPLLLMTTAWTTMMSLWALNRFIFIYCLCFWFDYRDRDDDGRSRWLTLVSMMTQQRALYVFYGLAACFTISLAILYRQGMAWRSIAEVGAPMFLLAGTAHSIPDWVSDYWYYVYLDSLLMLTGLLLYLL
ncbi:UbiA prenyltransferase family protein [Spirosoma horti]